MYVIREKKKNPMTDDLLRATCKRGKQSGKTAGRSKKTFFLFSGGLYIEQKERRKRQVLSADLFLNCVVSFETDGSASLFLAFFPSTSVSNTERGNHSLACSILRVWGKGGQMIKIQV